MYNNGSLLTYLLTST